MSTISRYFDYARLADAAYVDLSSTTWTDPVQVAIRADLALKLPLKLAQNTFNASPTGWQVAHYYDTENSTNGFAATLFKNSANRYVLGVRGTEPEGLQLVTDLLWADLKEIGFVGMAVTQATSLVNYILRLQAPSTATSVLQFDVRHSVSPVKPDPSALGQAGGWFWLAPRNNGMGLGKIPVGATIDVTGHSLGGHLAALTTRLFPALVNEAVIFNSPGYDTTAGNIVRTIAPAAGALPSAVLNAIGVEKRFTDEIMLMFRQHLAGVGDFFSDVTSLESEDLAAGDDTDLVSGQVTGTAFGAESSVAVEKNSHGMGQIVDSLTLQRMFHQLDPTSALAAFEKLYRNASNEDRTALEALLVSLERQLIAPTASSIVPIVEGGGILYISSGDFAARSNWYDRWQSIEANASNFQSLAGTLQITALDPSSKLASTAPTDFGQFIALKTLSPFALKALSGKQSTLNTVWTSTHGADFSAWTADQTLTPSQREHGQAHFSEHYYADRATLLATVLQRNATNNTTGVVPLPVFRAPVSAELNWYENGNINTSIATPPANPGAAVALNISFADDAGRTLTGNPFYQFGNRMYGGAGNDTLTGGNRSDYLEGGRGTDVINGGSGADILLGNQGIDELIGGSGNDWLLGGADADLRLEGGSDRDYLEGGAGFDNYYLSTSDTAVDTIFDSNNDGRLFVDGTMIGGFTCIQPNLYESTGGLHRMVVLGDGSTTSTATLYRKSDGRTLANIIGIQGPTMLGYTLPPPPNVGSPIWTFGPRPQDDTIRGTVVQGSTTLTPGFGQIRGWDGHDWIVGGTYSRMEIVGDTGNDVLYDPVLATNDAGQNTLLFGGAGSDFLYGTGASMTLSGGTGNDFISSARYNSAPIFIVLARGTNGELVELVDQAVATVVTGLGERLSLTGTEIAGALGSYDAGLQRWLFYYRPFSEGSAVGGATMLEDNRAFNHFLSAYITNGVIDRLLPSFAAEPGASPVNAFQLSWTTNPADPLAAANVSFFREDGVHAQGVVAHLLPNTTTFQIQAQDGNTSLPDRAYIDAGDNDDLVYGGAGRDIVQGGNGADRIDGAGGEDFIQGGAGDDFLVGGRFNNVIAGGMTTTSCTAAAKAIRCMAVTTTMC